MGSDIKDSSETNSVLNPTFHDVEIKLVEIINPNTSTVKFKDHGDHRESFKGIISPQFHATQENVIKTSNSPLLVDNSQDNKLQKNAVQFSDHVMAQKVDVGGFPLHVMTYPMEPNQSDIEARNPLILEDAGANWNKSAKQRHKEELLVKKQQLMESFSRNSRRHSAKRRENRFYEVAPGILVPEQPLTRTPNSGEDRNFPSAYNGIYANRAATVPGSSKPRVWTGHRSSNSRAVSTVSSRWMMDDPIPSKPNHFIKMPFKQMTAMTAENQAKPQEELFLPGDELRATTAFALSRIRHAFRRMALPSRLNSRQGRLLKARLRPMRPVPLNGPHISSCRGVQPEGRKQRTDSPDPAKLRELKEKYLEACSRHGRTTLQDEVKRRRNAHSATSEQSVHPTSPEPIERDAFCQEDFPLHQEFCFNEKTIPDNEAHTYYENYARENEFGMMSQKMAALRMDSSVIY